MDRRQERSDARQDQVDRRRRAAISARTLLDDQQHALEQPRPVALTAAQVHAERRPAGSGRGTGRERARPRREALREPRAAELRAQALQEREDTPAS